MTDNNDLGSNLVGTGSLAYSGGLDVLSSNPNAASRYWVFDVEAPSNCFIIVKETNKRRDSIMSIFSPIKFKECMISLEGIIRTETGGANIFSVVLMNGIQLYGEWQPILMDHNGLNYNIKIVSFGFKSKFNIDNTHPNAKMIISSQLECLLSELITKFFEEKISSGEFIFAPISERSHFLGAVKFDDNWVRR